jgi:hypothetical protein
MIRAEFERAYADMDIDDDYLDVGGLVSAILPLSIHCSSSSFSFQNEGEFHSDNIFDNLPSFSAPPRSAIADELAHYLQAPIEMKVANPIKWWFER